MKKIKFSFSGDMAVLFGESYELSVSSVREGIKALITQIPNLENYFLLASNDGIEFAVFKDNKNINLDEISFETSASEVKIMPVVVGNKQAGLFQTILGVAIIAVATIASGGLATAFTASGVMGGMLAMMGTAMALGGIVQLMSPQPQGFGSGTTGSSNPSYGFGGAGNTEAIGRPIPLLYTLEDSDFPSIEAGGAIISMGIYSEDEQ